MLVVQVKVDRTRTREEEVYDIVRDAGENTNFLCTPKGSSNLFCAFVNVCMCMCCVCIHKHTDTFDRTNLNNSALDNQQFRLHGTADHRVLGLRHVYVDSNRRSSQNIATQ